MKPFRYAALCTVFLTLTACQTFEGMKKDFGSLELPSLNNSSSSYDNDNLVYSGSCPQVQAVNDLKTLSEYADTNNMTEQNLISTVEIGDIQSACSYDEHSVTVDLQMRFDGRIGPQSRMAAGDRPSFSYPFFVAVTSSNGTILAKEIFSASMDYPPGENSKSYTEKLRQIIPIERKDRGAYYKVLVGFQLTPDQLAHNRLTLEQEKLAAQAAAQQPAPAEMQTMRAQEQAVKDTYVGAPVAITP